MDKGDIAGLALGNTVVGLGAGTATYFSFQPLGMSLALQIGVVAVGFGFFFYGYSLTQGFLHPERGYGFLVVVPELDRGDVFLLGRGVFVFLGLVGLALGLILFAETIFLQSIYMGFLSGFVCLFGYLCGHIGVNGVLI